MTKSTGIERHYISHLPLKANLVISHGMLEHQGRYSEFAQFLLNFGINVHSFDHKGHGSNCTPVTYAHLNKGDWKLVTNDLVKFISKIKETHPNTPLFLLGHSMGSYVALNAIEENAPIDGIILSGTSFEPVILTKSLTYILTLLQKLLPNLSGKWLQNIIFGPFNKNFSPKRTEFDWICSDESIVDKYIKDPLCGGIASTSFYRELFFGLSSIHSRSNLKKIKKELPILTLTGNLDPLSEGGKKVKKFVRVLKKLGVSKIEELEYANCRHECLNEPVKLVIWETLIAWMIKQVKA